MGKLHPICLKDVRWLIVLACITIGYGFNAAENFLPASVVAGLGLLLAAGPEAFYHWLHSVREAEDRALDGYEPDGSFVGDGVPRDQAGRPYEPLDWSRLKNRRSDIKIQSPRRGATTVFPSHQTKGLMQ